MRLFLTSALLPLIFLTVETQRGETGTADVNVEAIEAITPSYIAGVKEKTTIRLRSKDVVLTTEPVEQIRARLRALGAKFHSPEGETK